LLVSTVGYPSDSWASCLIGSCDHVMLWQLAKCLVNYVIVLNFFFASVACCCI